MADEPNKELDALAFEIYSKRVASHPVKGGGERDALDSYRKAEAFLAVRKKVRAGETKTKELDGPELCDCCAPNLPRNHPHNLVAKLYTDRKGTKIPGDITKVNRILAWLNKNPTPESDPEELVSRINREFPDLDWKEAEINTARAIFPSYANN